MVSVVVIGYNINQYIEECLESVINQTYENIEIIFVDDGSKDDTLRLAENKLGTHGRCLSKDNGGIISARKYGVMHSSGEYIVFIDGDDTINPDMVKNFIEISNRWDGRPDLITTDFYINKGKDGTITQSSKCGFGEYSGAAYTKKILENVMPHYMFPKMYRRDFLIRAGYLEFPDITMGEDLFTNSCLGMKGPMVVYDSSVNYYYRYNPESLTKKGDARILEQIKTLSLLEERFKEFADDQELRTLLYYQWYLYLFTYLCVMPCDYEVKLKLIEGCKERIDFKDPLLRTKIKTLSAFNNFNVKVYLINPKVGELLKYLITAGRKVFKSKR